MSGREASEGIWSGWLVGWLSFLLGKTSVTLSLHDFLVQADAAIAHTPPAPSSFC